VHCESDISEAEVLEVFEDLQSDYMTVNKESKVSVDYKMTEHSAILDAQWIKVLDNNVLKLVVWYDNEWAYAHRALDVARMACNG
jgi:glyceraldehyde-3-phosphate dehydrogenase/erythrose-4-phosphate dehydrogenase